MQPVFCVFSLLCCCAHADKSSFPGLQGNQQPQLSVVAIATNTTDLNGREMESEGCKGPILLFSTFSESTSQEHSGYAFPLGLTGSTEQEKAHNVDLSISLLFSKVQAVLLQEMAADDTIIVKVRLFLTEEDTLCD